MRTALSMPTAVAVDRRAVDELREGEPGRDGRSLVDDHGAGDRRLPDRAREHRRTASRPNEEERLRRRGLPARQVVIDLELSRRTGGGATDDSCSSVGVDEARVQGDLVPGETGSAAFHGTAKRRSARARGVGQAGHGQQQQCDGRTGQNSVQRHDVFSFFGVDPGDLP